MPPRRCGPTAFLHRDSSHVWVSVTATFQRGEDDPHFTIAIAEDISERKEIERLKSEFVSVVGHELRTPLTSIRGSLGEVLTGGIAGELPPEAKQMVDLAVDNSDRLVRLVNDTLELERLEAGRMQLDRRPAGLADLVRSGFHAVDALAAAADIRLVSAVGDVRLLADPDRVVQALVNQLGNAIKFSPRGGRVTGAAEARGSRALISVSDEGTGMPAGAALDTIFERFNQVDSSDARAKGGTGLGLAITRAIVDHHVRAHMGRDPHRGGRDLPHDPPAPVAYAIGRQNTIRDRCASA
jgi:signal transduction histidine kinase